MNLKEKPCFRADKIIFKKILSYCSSFDKLYIGANQAGGALKIPKNSTIILSLLLKDSKIYWVENFELLCVCLVLKNSLRKLRSIVIFLEVKSSFVAQFGDVWLADYEI